MKDFEFKAEAHGQGSKCDKANERVVLSGYTPGNFERGAGKIKESLWLIVSLVVFRLCPFSFSRLKCWILRAFGARIGKEVVIKPQVKITFPWKLEVGNHVWLGEETWLLNLGQITIGSNVCISQRAFLCTGSHNYKSRKFDLIVRPIIVGDGAWLGAGCWVGTGVEVGEQVVLTANSVATGRLEPWGIYQGNPAVLIKKRAIE